MAFNVVNRVHTREPFTITTFQLRGSRRVPTVLRVYLTGVNNVSPSFVPGTAISVRIGDTTISGSFIKDPVPIEPGVFAVDVTLPPALAGAGDRPIVVNVIFNGITYQSRLDDSAPRIWIL